MSCTVIALPISIAYLIVGLVEGSLVGASVAMARKQQQSQINGNYDQNLTKHIKELQQEILYDKNNENIDLTEFNYQTAYTNPELLMKTLREHGVDDLIESNGAITCEVENYKLTFSKNEESNVYEMKILCPEGVSPEDKINDLNSEYTSNVQEETYLHIIDKLKENNMELEHEEVLEDNTIVLTVNLE